MSGASDLQVEPFISVDFVENRFKHARSARNDEVFIGVPFDLKHLVRLCSVQQPYDEEELHQKLETIGILNNH